MKEKEKKNIAVRVFKSYTKSFSGYWFLTCLIFIFYGLASLISNTITPLFYREIIDIIAKNGIEGDVMKKS
ncbi:MAG: hypothetical protein KC736_00755 [Candidatus Moranbacteria bacterium]|nr:hypothetical protein [Candidatus Moranbacteria bacterium]